MENNQNKGSEFQGIFSPIQRLEINAQIQKMADERGITFEEMQEEFIQRSVSLFRRQRILAISNEAYERINNDLIESVELHVERSPWEVALMDGLEDDPPYPQGFQE